MRILFPGAAVCGAFILSGCAAPVPVYQPAPGAQTVPVTFTHGAGTLKMCHDTEHHFIVPTQRKEDGTFTALLPAGQRITIRNTLVYSGYNVTTTCAVPISLVPRAGTSLIVNNGFSANRCFIEVVRDNPATSTGVAVEPSLGEPQC